MLDGNGDGILTMNEVRENIGKIDLKLSQEDVQELINLLDKNTDGVISDGEFIDAMQSSLQTQNE